MQTSVLTGLENLIAAPPRWLANQRLGLLCNPASVDRRLRHCRDLIHERFPGRLTALYAPQHGFFAEKQDNMIESTHMTDPVLKIPIFSLYSETRRPTHEMLEPIDVLLVDLNDVGTRVYTFIYTIAYCMEAARQCNKKVLVLDRPNPIGGRLIEGNLLNPQWASFVGRYPLPMRHGLTVAELVRLFNDHFNIGCDLQVSPMRGWRRDMLFTDTGLPWIAPSPNLPTPASALVYPGQVIWEGTNISEGRGTTQPFELFGAPFIDPPRIIEQISEAMGGRPLPGAILRECCFEPTSNKWSGEPCRGFQLFVTDPANFRPYLTSIRLLTAIHQQHRSEFKWKEPPYEYEFEKLPIDLILGDQVVRQQIEQHQDPKAMADDWQADLEEFDTLRQRYFLYA